MSPAETVLYTAAEYVKLVAEAISILTVTWGILYSFYHYGAELFRKHTGGYAALRLSLARYLIVALEFQLAADILGTAIAPGWEEIGQLSAIAVIRTVLNYFLEREVRSELKMMDAETRADFEAFKG